MIKKYERRFKNKVLEADDNESKTLEAVKALIDMSDISTEDEQGKFIELLKGIVFADNAHGDLFLKKINDFTSGLKIEDFKESNISKKIKESEIIRFNTTLEASSAIAQIVKYLSDKVGVKNPKFYNTIGFGLERGLELCEEIIESPEIKSIVAKKIINNLKSRV